MKKHTPSFVRSSKRIYIFNKNNSFSLLPVSNSGSTGNGSTGNGSTGSNNWKQINYIGYSFNSSDQLNNYIELAHDNNITHINLEFIILGADYNGTINWSELVLSDTVLSWSNLTDDERKNIKNTLNQYNIKLMASFGGATSFEYNFSNTWKNESSKYYISDNGPFKTIEDSATALGNDLAVLAETYILDGIDLDIENFPLKSTYNGDYDDIYHYLGFISKAIKTYNNNLIVSHAPQPPFWNSENWPSLYLNTEKYYGNYINFYNWQYYNEGEYYNNEKSIFVDDTLNGNPGFGGAVLQIYKNADGIITCPLDKIIVGRATDAEINSIISWDDWTKIINSKSEYNSEYTSQQNTDLQEWYKVSGVMVWFYNINNNNEDNNIYQMKFFYDVYNYVYRDV